MTPTEPPRPPFAPYQQQYVPQQPWPQQGRQPYGQAPYPPQQPPAATRVAPQAKPRRQRRRRGHRKLRALLWSVIGLTVAITVIVQLTSGGGAKFTARVTGHAVINPADLGVTVRVTNTGGKAGTPTCTISAQDPSYTYTGIDVVTLRGSIAPGASSVFADNLTITKQGAGYVTQVTVSC